MRKGVGARRNRRRNFAWAINGTLTAALAGSAFNLGDLRMSKRSSHAEAKPLHPVALSLALWLGLMVCTLGVQRMAEQAVDHQAQQGTANSIQPGAAQFMPAVWRR